MIYFVANIFCLFVVRSTCIIILFVSNETHAPGHTDLRFSRHNLSRVTASDIQIQVGGDGLRGIYKTPELLHKSPGSQSAFVIRNG